jgi:hypothetical protein
MVCFRLGGTSRPDNCDDDGVFENQLHILYAKLRGFSVYDTSVPLSLSSQSRPAPFASSSVLRSIFLHKSTGLEILSIAGFSSLRASIISNSLKSIREVDLEDQNKT